MPKVMRIINRFNLGGPTFNVSYLSRYLEAPYETLLVGGMKDASEDSSEFIVEKLGLEPHIIPEMRREISLGDDWKAYHKLKKLMANFQPDIVHTHASKAGTLGRLAAHRLGVPVILHTFHGHVFHSYFGALKTNFYKAVERYLAQRSTRIIAISEKQKAEISGIHRICPADKIEIVPLGFDLSRFQEDREAKRQQFRDHYQLKDEDIAIGIVGRLVPIKNHQLFLDAFARVLSNTERPVKAFIIGDGESREELEAYTASLQLDFAAHPEVRPAAVTFTSWIRDVDRVYAGLDIVALTSLNEGTPVSLIEAQAAQKPIVTTNVGGVENIVVPDGTAFLCNSFEPEAFAEKLAQLVTDDALRTRMAEGGWEHVRQRFHYTRLVANMAELYERLLAEKSR